MANKFDSHLINKLRARIKCAMGRSIHGTLRRRLHRALSVDLVKSFDHGLLGLIGALQSLKEGHLALFEFFRDSLGLAGAINLGLDTVRVHCSAVVQGSLAIHIAALPSFQFGLLDSLIGVLIGLEMLLLVGID